MSLTIEVGKVYKLRNGDQGVVLAIILGVAVGYLIDGSIVPCKWELNGRESYDNEHRDIISLWINPPVVDWSKFPAWIVALAMDENGEWTAYIDIPIMTAEAGSWWYDFSSRQSQHFYLASFGVRKEHRPVFSGDWRDSLAVRPGWEEGKSE